MIWVKTGIYPGPHCVHEDKKKEAAIELKFLAKDYYIDEMRCYVALGRTKTLYEAMELAFDWDAMNKIAELRKKSVLLIGSQLMPQMK